MLPASYHSHFERNKSARTQMLLRSPASHLHDAAGLIHFLSAKRFQAACLTPFLAAKTYEQKAGFPASLIQRGWKLTFSLPGGQIWTFLASGDLSERSARSPSAFLSDVLTHSTAHACSQIVCVCGSMWVYVCVSVCVSVFCLCACVRRRVSVFASARCARVRVCE